MYTRGPTAVGFLALIGFALPVAFRFHPYRVLALVPPAVTGLLVGLLGVGSVDDPNPWALGLIGFCGGLVGGASVRNHSPSGSPEMSSGRHGPNLIKGVAAGVLAGILCFTALPAAAYLVFTGGWPAWVLAGVIVVAVWVVFRRPVVELGLRTLALPFYRVRAVGPGLSAIPASGPCLVIANHAAYLDPLFLAYFVPRPVTPMMTALFYDRPGIRHLMRYIFVDTIRVPETPLKREAAEIKEAVAALDAGKCVVIFPEGYLRRKEDQELRRFGRGVWEIVRARPGTPVVACWVEGGWGSYFSFKGGPPTKNKRAGFRHRIDVGVLPPERVPADILADHIATRFHLMNRVMAARKPLGLPDLPAVEMPNREE